MDNNNNEIIIEELNSLLWKECFEEYFTKVHLCFCDEIFCLSDVEALLKNLCDKRIELEKWDYDDWGYITLDEAYELGIRYIFVELRKMLWDRRAILKDGIIITGGQSLDLCAVEMYLKNSENKLFELLRQSPESFPGLGIFKGVEKITDRIDMFNDFFSKEIRRLYNYGGDENVLIYKLLDHFREGRAIAMYNLIEYITECTPHVISEEDFQDTDVKCDTRKQLIEWVAWYTHTTYCYFFLERGNPDEFANYGYAVGRYENATSFEEFVIGVTEETFWLQMRPVFLKSAYRALTDQDPVAPDYFIE